MHTVEDWDCLGVWLGAQRDLGCMKDGWELRERLGLYEGWVGAQRGTWAV